MSPDGNCFHRAVAVGLYGSEKRHLYVRNAIVTFVETNLDHFLGSYVDNHEGYAIGITEDLREIRIQEPGDPVCNLPQLAEHFIEIL